MPTPPLGSSLRPPRNPKKHKRALVTGKDRLSLPELPFRRDLEIKIRGRGYSRHDVTRTIPVFVRRYARHHGAMISQHLITSTAYMKLYEG